MLFSVTDRIKDLNQMLLLKKCSTRSRKKKVSASSIHISKDILENLWELRRKRQELFRITEKCVAEWETLNIIQEDWLSCPHCSLLLPPPHTPSSQEKKSSFLLDKWAPPAFQQISRREEIFKRYPRLSLELLAEPILFYKNACWGWEIKPQESSGWIQGLCYEQSIEYLLDF